MEAAYDKNGVRIYQGNCLEVLKALPAESVNCCVTSPPYWGLRQYLFANAVCLRNDLTDEERSFVLQELEKRGIKPKTGRDVQGGDSLEKTTTALE